MYCIFFKFGGGIELFFVPHPLTPKKFFGGDIKNDVTEMIHLLTFQSINNVLYVFIFWGGSIEILFIPPPHYTKKLFWGWGVCHDLKRF